MSDSGYTYTSPPGQGDAQGVHIPRTGEYYDHGDPALPPQSPQRQAPTSMRLGGAVDTLASPIPRLVASAALAIGGAMSVFSEFNKGAKGHHSKTGKYGRVLVGAGATYFGLVWALDELSALKMGS